MFGIISKRLFEGVQNYRFIMQIGGAVEWRSVIIVARALPSVSRFLTPTDVPTVPGSPMLSGLRPLWTVLRAMCTLVPDASVLTRLSGLSNPSNQLRHCQTAMPFFVLCSKNRKPAIELRSPARIEITFQKIRWCGRRTSNPWSSIKRGHPTGRCATVINCL